ncbi:MULTISPECIES: transglutaminase domain-containing protein [Methanothrix]|jgi:hypothetical protein|uniref:Transglutaminase-like domain-containing protein n=4 Tax=root TaxID=1 RepID=F4BVT4_METSG|nr:MULTISPECIES: transglutaminase domain-containing protein [Methanothrix]OPX77781.1 MAG: Transglutaminase-like superfamily protein [Methanosaeta sp. PtaB.Bin005]AEB67194.1 conserved hypothetical protein [Methanothrix soehngenii GP6]MBP7069336.1 transglutaminase-like cysteine peptidase [Methanothrix sp.]MDY0412190.1 transglutaminase-like cysteine peptidase [Methanothrix soehngenii]NLJ22259.1 transglutaminase-like cysteine peptidase [Methanothrix soehngenii]
MITGCNWAGEEIVRDTIVYDKRVVIGSSGILIPTDVRDWLSHTHSKVIARALEEMALPASREAGTFDMRAWRSWDYVTRSIDYVTDKSSFGLEDLWLFPEETLMLGKGDCEDTSFLLASLLLASGISEQCVRVVLGRVASPAGSYGHAWVVYQCESGQWCLLETTLESAPPSFTPADPFTLPGNQYQYQPQFCLNSSHLWSMTRMKNEFTDYLKIRVKPQQPVPSE